MTDHDPGGHIGSRLRDIRRSRGLSLRDVEEQSAGQLTAGAVGSYERGVRVISVERLLDLCALYECAPHDVVEGLDLEAEPFVVIDLERVHASDEIDLARLCEHVARQRRSFNDRYLSLRIADLERVAAARGQDYGELVWQLRQSGLALGNEAVLDPIT